MYENQSPLNENSNRKAAGAYRLIIIIRPSGHTILNYRDIR